MFAIFLTAFHFKCWLLMKKVFFCIDLFILELMVNIFSLASFVPHKNDKWIQNYSSPAYALMMMQPELIVVL